MSETERLHATAVAVERRGLLILGPSGSGKSSLALELMAMGADLIADDVVQVERREEHLSLSAPRGDGTLIEARGIGLLRAPLAPPTPLSLVIDLGRRAEGRLPPPESWTRFGVSVPLLARPERLLAAAVRCAILAGGPVSPDASLGALGLASGAGGDQSRAVSGESGGPSAGRNG